MTAQALPPKRPGSADLAVLRRRLAVGTSPCGWAAPPDSSETQEACDAVAPVVAKSAGIYETERAGRFGPWLAQPAPSLRIPPSSSSIRTREMSVGRARTGAQRSLAATLDAGGWRGTQLHRRVQSRIYVPAVGVPATHERIGCPANRPGHLRPSGKQAVCSNQTRVERRVMPLTGRRPLLCDAVNVTVPRKRSPKGGYSRAMVVVLCDDQSLGKAG